MALSYLEPETNSSTVDSIEEISIVIAAKNLTPTIMSWDFLKFSGIVPQDWELSEQPVLNPNYAQLNFSNGISITAQSRTITIGESLNGKELTELNAPQIAVKYIEKLPHAEYLGLSFNPKILLPFPDSPQKPRQFITEKLLNSGVWKDIGRVPMQAGVNLMYLLDRCQLTVNVSEARLRQQNMPLVTALLFSGSFNYEIGDDAQISATQRIIQLINYCQEDVQTFRDIIREKFLAAANDDSGQSAIGESVFPGTLL